jgi:hypothetical protein
LFGLFVTRSQMEIMDFDDWIGSDRFYPATVGLRALPSRELGNKVGDTVTNLGLGLVTSLDHSCAQRAHSP